MELSKRLQAVADSVTPGNRVADVGCDHAYISIYLIEHGISTKVVAMDVNRGPLERAKENIDRKGYGSRIQVRLSNGVEKLEPDEADSILIAGMGGALVIRILEEGSHAVRQCKELILQPQSEIPLVRKYLHEIGFAIIEEQMLEEDGKYYDIIKAVPSLGSNPYEKEVFYQYGKLLLEGQDLVTKQYLLREKRLKGQVMEELNKNLTENTRKRLSQVEQEMNYIDESLLYYK
jgi:tRNA (adenine22-N1)-methyltransferase